MTDPAADAPETAWLDTLRPLPVDGLQALYPDAAAAGSAPLPSERAIRRRIRRRRSGHLERVSRAVELLSPLPRPDEIITATMTGGIDGWAVIAAVVELLAPVAVQELRISTLGFSSANTQALVEMLDAGRVKALPVFLVSCYFRSVDRSVFDELAEALAIRTHALSVRRTHAKVQLIRATDGRRFVIESSGNLRSCKNLEVFSLSADPELYQFHQAWMETLVAQGSDK